jgi:hypothetical protein
MLATEGFDEDQVAELVTSLLVTFLLISTYVAVAVNTWVPPTVIVELVGAIPTAVNVLLSGGTTCELGLLPPQLKMVAMAANRHPNAKSRVRRTTPMVLITNILALVVIF